MITLTNEKLDRKINVPTTMNDITPEILKKLTVNVTLPENRVLVALCWKVNFGDVFFNNKNKNNSAVVVPICAKLNLSDDVKDSYKFLEVGKKVVLTRSALEMGVHVHIPNSASMQSIEKWATDATQAQFPGSKSISINVLPEGKFILIEFKIVSAADISGVIESDILPEDPFVVSE
jgi:hypothetical protein